MNIDKNASRIIVEGVIKFFEIDIPNEKISIDISKPIDDFDIFQRVTWESHSPTVRIGGVAHVSKFATSVQAMYRNLRDSFSFGYLLSKHSAERFLKKALSVYGRHPQLDLLESLVVMEAMNRIRNSNAGDFPVDNNHLMSTRIALAEVFDTIQHLGEDSIERERKKYLDGVNQEDQE